MLTLYNWSLTFKYPDQNSAKGNAHEMTKAKHISHITHHYIDYLADGYLQVRKSVNISAL